MRTYVPQRRVPPSDSSISSSVGFLRLLSNATALMISPLGSSRTAPHPRSPKRPKRRGPRDLLRCPRWSRSAGRRPTKREPRTSGSRLRPMYRTCPTCGDAATVFCPSSADLPATPKAAESQDQRRSPSFDRYCRLGSLHSSHPSSGVLWTRHSGIDPRSRRGNQLLVGGWWKRPRCAVAVEPRPEGPENQGLLLMVPQDAGAVDTNHFWSDR